MLIHFLNHQVLHLHGLLQRYPADQLAAAIEQSLIAAVLVSERPVIIPTVDIVQSPVSSYLRDTLQRFTKHGHVEFVGSTTDIDELVTRKRLHFQGTGYHPEWGGKDPHEVLSPLARTLHFRQGDTTYDMLSCWSHDINQIANKKQRNNHRGSFSQRQLRQAFHLLPQTASKVKYLDSAYCLPDRLGDHAFLWNVVQRVEAFEHDSRGPAQRSFERALAYYWVMSHVDEYDEPIIGRDSDLGLVDCGLRHQDARYSFDMAGFRVFLHKLGLTRLIRSTGAEVCRYKDDPLVLMLISEVLMPVFARTRVRHDDNTETAQTIRRLASATLRVTETTRSWHSALPRIAATLLEIGEHPAAPHRSSGLPKQTRQASTWRNEMAGTTIFIGHGQSPAWHSLRDLIRDRLHLGWEEFDRTPTAGKTVTQRLSEMLDGSDFAFLVLTAEDEQKDGKIRARQNVVHELGLFQGRLGFDRAIALIEEGCDEFANLAGLVQIRFPKGNIMAVSEVVRRVLEDRFPQSLGEQRGVLR